MVNRVLLIRSEQTFMTNALVSNMKNANFEVREVGFSIKEIEAKYRESELLLLYADEELESDQSVPVYLKDLCQEENCLLIVIGNKNDLKFIATIIPPHLLLDVVERPIDMGFFIERITNLMDEEHSENRKKSILLVDDDVSCLQLLRGWLKDDYRVGMARSGMQAITWLARHHVDLILLDYEMPVTTGAQIYEMLKSEPYSENIPVMFLTGKRDKDVIMEVMSLKPAGYLLKSITRHNLLLSLENFFLDKKRS
ncbi:MAG: response regulator [Lachnospiraceae bacterium]|nr:response regulator [Lachnospiraceae bacterium]